MNIGDNIRKIRELKGYSQEYMAMELGISQPSYARIENGMTVPKIDRLQRIANILNVELSVLFDTTNYFNIIFNAEANQSGYINNQIISVDKEQIRNIIKEVLREELNKK